jgi:hypothetical protein
MIISLTFGLDFGVELAKDSGGSSQDGEDSWSAEVHGGKQKSSDRQVVKVSRQPRVG